jgi:periplasmic copper chaperone A
VSYERRKLAAPVEVHGRSVGETTSLIHWEGGTLQSDVFDDFALMGKVADGATGSLAFRTVQTCEKGETDWKGGLDSKEPAPVLQIAPGTRGRRVQH